MVHPQQKDLDRVAHLEFNLAFMLQLDLAAFKNELKNFWHEMVFMMVMFHCGKILYLFCFHSFF
jgi:hypothetical protein